ncbi:MAG: DUF1799 domain-containing protein [FCB group bacterium]|nr:DUF1799 domain-containing protein [FCB group bacterium]
MAGRLSCEDCRATFSAYENENPPCGSENKPDFTKCHYRTIDLWPGNLLVWETYSIVSDQHIMGSMGPVTLDINAVFNVMDRKEIDKKEQLEMLETIRKAYGKVMEQARLKQGLR